MNKALYLPKRMLNPRLRKAHEVDIRLVDFQIGDSRQELGLGEVGGTPIHETTSITIFERLSLALLVIQ